VNGIWKTDWVSNKSKFSVCHIPVFSNRNRARGSIRLDRLLPSIAQLGKPDIRGVAEILQSGLVLCFPYQSARIDPVAISLFLMGIGGGWIVVGLVVMDRL
jgi:hypothetical protein